MNFIENCKTFRESLILEKLIIGVEEPIFITGVGKILAKVDSGNSAYNVIHGEDFYYQGNVVVFTTYDESGNPHKVSRKIKDKVLINIGAGHTEERPVILMDVIFADTEYKNIPFTVGNRSENKNKVLLGKQFISKKLDALIDVSKTKISNKEIDVKVNFSKKKNKDKKEITEATSADNTNNNEGGNRWLLSTKKHNVSGAASATKKGWQMVKGITKGTFDTLKTLATLNINAAEANRRIKAGWQEAAKIIDDYQKTDKFLIFKAMNSYFMNVGDPISPFVKNPQVFKILDYYGTDYENNSVLDNTNQEAKIEPEDQEKQILALPNYNEKENQNKQPQEKQVLALPNYDENDIKTESYLINIIKEADNQKTWKKAQKSANKNLNPILYLVIYNENQVKRAKEILSNAYSNIKGNLGSMLNNIKETFNVSSTEEVIDQFKNLFSGSDILYTFAICEGTGNDRKVRFLSQVKPTDRQISFLNENVRLYKNNLITDKRFLDVLKGTFNNNKTFGFSQWYEANKNSLPDGLHKAIESWINDENILKKGFNLKKAYSSYLYKNNEEDIDDTVSDRRNQEPIQQEKEELKQEEPIVSVEPDEKQQETIEIEPKLKEEEKEKLDSLNLTPGEKSQAYNMSKLPGEKLDLKDRIKLAKLADLYSKKDKVDENGFGPKTREIKDKIGYLQDFLDNPSRDRMGAVKELVKLSKIEPYSKFIIKMNSKKNKMAYYIFDFNTKRFKPIVIKKGKLKDGSIGYVLLTDKRKLITPKLRANLQESRLETLCIENEIWGC